MSSSIDLRSDTVTLPPPEMRQAIAGAPLGDDVYGEDPTVNALEARVADILGKEAAILTPSGTMANLMALMAHCSSRKRILVGDLSDIWNWEAGGASILGGLLYHPLPTSPNGELSICDIETALYDEENSQCVRAGVICLENTHCLCGGRALSLEYLSRLHGSAQSWSLPVHLDGARLFNAAVALGIDARQIAASADSVTICLSKGLAAPIGSVLAGTEAFVGQVRRLRKMLGGGMRQAGIIAGAGIYALENMIDRLSEDHANAARLAQGLKQIAGIQVQSPQTNMVFWTLIDPDLSLTSFLRALKDEGVHIAELRKGRLRAVTHYGISARDIDFTVQAVGRALANCQAHAGSRTRKANDLTAMTDVQPQGTLLLRSIH